MEHRINGLSEQDSEILVECLSKDDDKSAKALFDRLKIDPNTLIVDVYEGERPMSLFEYIIGWRAPKILKLMFDYGLDVNFLPSGDIPPLHQCCVVNSPECARVIVEHKDFKHLNTADGADMTAIGVALQHINGEMVKLLAESGADIHRIDEFGESLLDSAFNYLGEVKGEGNDEAADVLRDIISYLMSKGVKTCDDENDDDEDSDDSEDSEYFKTRAQYGYLHTDEYAGLYTLTSNVPTLLPKNYEVEGVENPQQQGASVPYYLALVVMGDNPRPLGFVDYEEAIEYLRENNFIVDENEESYFVTGLSINELEEMYDCFEL